MTENTLVIKNIASIFVEGAIDRIMYKTLFTKVLNYRQLNDDELEALQNETGLGNELIPLKDSIVLYSDSRNSLITIKSKGGKDNLLKFLEENSKGINLKRLRESIELDVCNLFIAFVFDEDMDAEKLYELKELYRDTKEVLIETQPTPEKIGLEIFVQYFLNEHSDWKEWFECCSKMLQSVKSDKFDKRQFSLAKALIGERCYYQLFEELFGKDEVKQVLIVNTIKWINSLNGLI